MENALEIINFTKLLVETPSQNGIDSEEAIAGLVFDKLTSFGFSPKMVGDNESPSVYCEIKKGNGKTIWLESCLDTVPAGDASKWNTEPLKTIEKDGKLFGRGIADSKIAIALFSYLAKELNESPDFTGNIILGFDSNEQSGEFTGIKDILNQKPKADVCILGYQGIDEISIGARGWLRLEVTIFGESAHTGSRTSRGVNAIHQAAKAINAISNLGLNEVKEECFEYGSSLNVSIIEGGSVINVVPDKCTFKVDIRIIPSQNKDEIIEKIKDAIKTSGAEFEIKELQFTPAYISDRNSDFIKNLQEIASKDLNKNISLVTSGAGSVGNVISKLDIPIINCFGVESGNVHAPNEWINSDTIPSIFQIYKKAIIKYSDEA